LAALGRITAQLLSREWRKILPAHEPQQEQDGPLSLSLSPPEGERDRERGRFMGPKRELVRGILSLGERENLSAPNEGLTVK